MGTNTGDETLSKHIEELTQWRNSETAEHLRKIRNLTSSISTSLKDINRDVMQICNETNDIKYQFESDDSLRIGKESVRPLIELKNIGTEVFADLSESNLDDSNFNEDIDFGPAYQELEKIKKFASRSTEYIKLVCSLVEGIELLENESEKTVRSESTLSVTGSDPSTSGFSLFDNVATSSPISKSDGQ